MAVTNSKTKVFKVIAIVSFFLLFIMNCTAQEFFVSPSGNDLNPGNKNLLFRTISFAKKQVKKWIKTQHKKNVLVWLSGGKYILRKTIVFGLEDSSNITYSAMTGISPVIVSDIIIKGWKKLLETTPKGLPKQAKGKIWTASIPKGEDNFKVMYNYNADRMLPRARTSAFDHLRQFDGYIGINKFQNTIPSQKKLIDSIFNPHEAEIVVIPLAPMGNEYFTSEIHRYFNRNYFGEYIEYKGGKAVVYDRTWNKLREILIKAINYQMAQSSSDIIISCDKANRKPWLEV